MKTVLKSLMALFLSFSYNESIHATVLEHNNLHFKIETEALMRGEIHYSYQLLSPRELVKKYPVARAMDSLRVLSEKNIKVLITKSVYVVNRPVGFFDHEQMKDENYLNHILGEQKVSRISSNTFNITVPGTGTHSYHMSTYFDSDDISTLPNTRIIHGVSAVKKLDIIAQSASAILFREFSSFSDYAVGGSSISSYIPLKEGKTLVISYNLLAVKNNYANNKLLKSNFIIEINANRDLINSYQE